MSTDLISPARIAEALGQPAPTEEQAAVIAGETQPTLVVAGAGAGKTETMAARVVWLVANGLASPAEVLGLTFTRKAAQQLSRRIRKRLVTLASSSLCTGPGSVPAVVEAIRTTDPQISTYHAYAGTLLSAYGLLVPVEPEARLLSQTAVFQLAHDVVSRWESPLTSNSTPASITANVLALAGRLSEHLVTTDDLRADPDDVSTLIATLPGGPRQKEEPTAWLRGVLDTQSHREELADLVDAVAARLRAESALDHSSQMALAATLARDHAVVGESERRAFGVVLLDEYQDTGHSQRVLLSSLFGGGRVPVPAVTAVGDPMQSIYGWRGASASNLERFRTDFPRAGGEPAAVLELTTSWRNPPEVLRLANRVTEPLREAAGAVPVPELRAAPGAPPGDVEVAVFDTVDEEREWLADGIARRHAELSAGGSPPTAAVLVRRNADAAPIAERLRERGLAVEIVGVGGLLDVPEVADVVALLTVVARPWDGPALLRLLTGTRYALGAADLAALAHRASELSPGRRSSDESGSIDDAEGLEAELGRIASGEAADSAGLADALADPGSPARYSEEGAGRLRALARVVADLRTRVGSTPARLVAAAEEALGLDVEVRVRVRVDGGEGREQLDALHAVAAGYGGGVTAGLEGFLDHLEVSRDVESGLPRGETVAQPGRVQILTVHSAKGLEWQIVAVPHVVTGRFPGERSPETALRTASQLPESLRGDRASEDNPGGAPVPRLDRVVDRKQLEDELKAHIAAVGRRTGDEDRRLFYVALTRSERALLVSGAHWAGPTRTPAGPSRFLEEVLGECRGDGPAGIVAHEVTEPSETNPLTAETIEATWPPAGGSRRPGALQVRTAEPIDLTGEGAGGPEESEPDADTGPPDEAPALSPEMERRRRDAVALLEERRRAEADRARIDLPRRLSASEVVALAGDPEAFAARLRRPLPYRPDRFARRGTRFHAWLEHRFGAEHLLDLDDLPGAGDAGGSDAELAELQEAFERSRWATLTPEEVEVPFEVALGPHLLRGRMDAVFRSGDGWIVVDWKTGHVPSESEMPAVAIQLAVYRYAWGRILAARTGEEPDPSRIRAAFHHVRPGLTVEPADLPDAGRLLELLDRGAGPDPGHGPDPGQ